MFLNYDSPTEKWVVSFPNGRKYFFGTNQRYLGTKEPDGELITAEYELSGLNRLTSVMRVGGNTGLVYTYVSGSELIETVTLTLNEQVVRRSVYTYYEGVDPGGTTGDVKTATLQRWNSTTEVWETLTVSFYRYYVFDGDDGFVHGLKFALGPEAYARFKATYPMLDPENATDGTLAAFADYHFRYDNLHRVTLETTRAGAHTYSFSYAARPSSSSQSSSSSSSGAPMDDFNTWMTRTTVAQPDGTQEIVYANRFAQVILKVLRTHEGEWCRYWRYNNLGQVILGAEPSAVSSYDERLPDLVALRPNQGLVRTSDYYASGESGGAPSRRNTTRVRAGALGIDAILSKREYLSRVADGETYYFPWKTTHYIDTAATEAVVVTYGYTWHGDTTAVQQRTTTLPVVSTTQNGSGVANQIVETFDLYGNRTSQTDERGFVREWTWDAGVQGITRQVINPPGLALTTDYTLDEIGRTVRELGPEHEVVPPGSGVRDIRRGRWTLYLDLEQEVRTTEGYQIISTGAEILLNPVRITRRDKIGRIVEEIEAVRESSSALSSPISQTQYSRWSKFIFDNWSRLVSQRVFHHIPAVGQGQEGFDYGESRFFYDTFSRRIAVRSPGGTITRNVLDSRGLVAESWVGTDDTGATVADPGGNGATNNNMTRVEAREYDRGAGGGDGLLTEIVVFPSVTQARVTTYDYDFRWRRVVIRGEHGLRETYTLDNLDRVTAVQRWNDEGVAPLRVASNETLYDSLGRVYRTIRYAIDPATGTATIGLSNDTWFDRTGNVMKRRNPEDAGFEKLTYDAAGRLTHRYAGYNSVTPSYSEAQTVANDTIFEQSDYTLDGAGNVIKEIRRERFHNTSGTGPLGGPSGATPNARALYTMLYPDPLGRLQASCNYGTNGGTVPARDATIPGAADHILVTAFVFNERGEMSRTLDPNEVVTAQVFDDAGRLIKTIESEGVHPEAGELNRTTKFAYTLDGRLAVLTALNVDTGEQVTRWIYGTTLADSGVASNALVRAKIYPDSDDLAPGFNGPDSVYDRVEFRYNARGELIEQKDQNGTVHSYVYDRLGRLLHDRATAVAAGIDGAVARISRAYDFAGRLGSVTSWDSDQVGAGSIVNQVAFSYNVFDQLTEDCQSHDGPAEFARSPSVRYTYADGTDRHIRRLSTVYPNGRQVVLYYDEPGTADNALGRVAQIWDSNAEESVVLAAYTRRGLSATMRVEYSATSEEDPVEMTYIKLAGEPNGDAGDQYTGQDRFNRIVDIRWRLRTTDAPRDRIQYGFDRAGNRLWRKNVVAVNNWDELYTYDSLYQLTIRQRGTLNSEHNALTDEADAEHFGYDPTGNWNSLGQMSVGGGPETGQSRRHNRANEIVSIEDYFLPVGLNPTVGYDRAGNMTRTPKVGDWSVSQTPIWDAWNRLVAIQEGNVTIGLYRYDGLSRRVTKESLEGPNWVRRHFYYSDQWQVLEERVDTETTAERQFVWGLRYIDDLILRDRVIEAELERLYATHDQWHVISTLDANGNTTERYAYRAFGEMQVLTPAFLPRSSSDYAWETTFGAYRRDHESKFYYARHRYLDCSIGRWLSRDPLVDAEVEEGANLFAYVGNRAVNLVDPRGLDAHEIALMEMSRGESEELDIRCALRVLKEWDDIKTKKFVAGTDNFFHCVAGCEATRQCKCPKLVFFMMWQKETKDYMVYEAKGRKDNTGKYISPEAMKADMALDIRANAQGIFAPPGLTCIEACQSQLDNLAPRRRPFMKEYRTQWP